MDGPDPVRAAHAVVDRLWSKPGVIAVGITSGLPASDASAQSVYTVEGVSVDSWKLKFAAFAITYGDYFTAMRIPLLDGRYKSVAGLAAAFMKWAERG